MITSNSGDRPLAFASPQGNLARMSTAEIIREIARLPEAERRKIRAYLLRKRGTENSGRRKLVVRKHPVSGLPYDATPGPVVSQTEIDAALADFP